MLDKNPLTGEDLVRIVVELASRPRVSDIHFGSGFSPWIRVDGDIVNVTDIPAMSNVAIDDFTRLIQGTVAPNIEDQLAHRGAYTVIFQPPGSEIRCRIAIFRTRLGYSAAIRVLPTTPPPIDSLSIPSDIIRRLSNTRSGLSVIAGPNGVGKSTLLAAVVQAVADRRGMVVYTLDEQTEYIYRSDVSAIHQISIGKGLNAPDYEHAIPGLLQGNPDLVVLSECRTTRALEAALMLAETGIRVLLTLHIESVTAVVDRIVGAFQPAEQPNIRTMLANTLREAIYIQLARRLEPTENYGRIPACEYLFSTPELRSLILEDNSDTSLKNYVTSHPNEMMLLEDSLVDLVVNKKLISVEAALDVVIRKTDFEEKLKRAGGSAKTIRSI